jgi:hypothetical protein
MNSKASDCVMLMDSAVALLTTSLVSRALALVVRRASHLVVLAGAQEEQGSFLNSNY